MAVGWMKALGVQDMAEGPLPTIGLSWDGRVTCWQQRLLAQFLIDEMVSSGQVIMGRLRAERDRTTLPAPRSGFSAASVTLGRGSARLEGPELPIGEFRTSADSITANNSEANGKD